jgi:hypothetical protein
MYLEIFNRICNEIWFDQRMVNLQAKGCDRARKPSHCADPPKPDQVIGKRESATLEDQTDPATQCSC